MYFITSFQLCRIVSMHHHQPIRIEIMYQNRSSVVIWYIHNPHHSLRSPKITIDSIWMPIKHILSVSLRDFVVNVSSVKIVKQWGMECQSCGDWWAHLYASFSPSRSLSVSRHPWTSMNWRSHIKIDLLMIQYNQLLELHRSTSN